MKLTVNSKALMADIAPAIIVCGRTHSIPVQEMVCLTATSSGLRAEANSGTYVSVQHRRECDVKKYGTCLVPGKQFADVLRACPEKVELSLVKNLLVITGSTFSAKIAAEEPSTFYRPEMPERNYDLAPFNADLLADRLKGAMPFLPDHDLGIVWLNEGGVFATDQISVYVANLPDLAGVGRVALPESEVKILGSILRGDMTIQSEEVEKFNSVITETWFMSDDIAVLPNTAEASMVAYQAVTEKFEDSVWAEVEPGLIGEMLLRAKTTLNLLDASVDIGFGLSSISIEGESPFGNYSEQVSVPGSTLTSSVMVSIKLLTKALQPHRSKVTVMVNQIGIAFKSNNIITVCRAQAKQQHA